MKFKCAKTDLTQSIQTVSKAVSIKNQNPILSGIYIKAENNIPRKMDNFYGEFLWYFH